MFFENMKKEITREEFIDSFQKIRPDNFSRNGLIALFDYLTEYEESTDEQIKLDVIALCCDYTEYESLGECLKNYDNIIDKTDLENHTQVI